MCIYVLYVPCIIAELSFRKKLCRYLEIKAERHDSARAIETIHNLQTILSLLCYIMDNRARGARACSIIHGYMKQHIHCESCSVHM